MSTNNKKLIEPFLNFGYVISQEEDYGFEFKELFHISMRLQRMIAVLLLKASGYSGYIQNNQEFMTTYPEKP